MRWTRQGRCKADRALVAPEGEPRGWPRAVALLLALALVVGGCALPQGIQAASAATTARGLSRASALASPIPPVPAHNFIPTAAPAVSAAEAYLIDPATGTVYYALNANHEMAMASTTKLMTALVAVQYSAITTRITIGPDAVAMENGISSVAGLRLGERMTLEDLLYCLLLPSGDDAAVAIAHGVAGSQQAFVGLMNLQATLMGLGHTHYMNPHGLDAPGQYTTAHDLAVLATLFMRNPTLRQIAATSAYTIPATANHHQYVLTNTNELLSAQPFQYAGAIGIKTGFTGHAGYCLVFMANGPQGQLLGVLLGEPTYDGRFSDATALLNWGFAQQAREEAGIPAAEHATQP